MYVMRKLQQSSHTPDSTPSSPSSKEFRPMPAGLIGLMAIAFPRSPTDRGTALLGVLTPRPVTVR
jgi:hypothetical protein